MRLHCQAPNGRTHGTVCNAGLGETPHLMELVGVFERFDDRLRAVDDERERDTRRCPRCGWFSVYRVLSPNANLTEVTRSS